MKKRILSVILALCLCISTQSVAYAGQGELLQQEDALAEEAKSKMEARDAIDPTEKEVYESMIALKDEYPEGMPWTNANPEGDYRWQGGPLGGKNIVAVGCVAFAFILSDAAFGELKARMYMPGEFEFEDIKPGDILRVNGNSHTVIVLEATDAGVIVAEGNYNASIHWGRPISKEQVMNSVSAYITRYPITHVSEEDPDANQSIASGELAEGLTWNLTKAGTLTISGKGRMEDFESIEVQPWKDYREQILKVVIEDGVTSIGACAFGKCGIFSAEIPTSVTEIGSSAFAESSILYVNLPSSVRNIGSYSFQKCLNLSTVTVSEGVEVIGSGAFSSCTSLTAIALPASIKEVGEAAFFSCAAMISATFAPGSQQVKLGNQMFMECQRLMNITLPQSIDSMGEEMFMNCMTLAEVEIPQGVNSIDMKAFASSGLYTILIPNSVTTIGLAAFANCPSLSEIYFTGTETEWNNNVSKIGDTLQVVQKTSVICNYSPTEITNENTVVTLSQDKYDYDGVDKTPTVTVKVNNQPLTFRDCTITYSDNTEPGTATVTVTGKFRYTGSATATFTIVGDGASGGTGGDDGNGDTGGDDGNGGTGGDDGNGGGSGGTGGDGGNGGTGGDSGTGSGGSTGIIADISKADITLDKTSYIYDGTAKTPSVTVKLGGKTLVFNTDYTVSYSNNIKAGTAAAIVTGKGKYTGSKTVNFTIAEAAEQNPAVSIICKKTLYKVAYGAEPFKINAVSEGKLTFTSSKPKIAAVDKNTGEVTIKNTGVAVITVQAGSVSKQVTVKISPKKQSVKSAKAVKGRKLTVKWAKDKKASGYQVQVSTDKKFKKNLKTKKTSKTSYTVTKLKTGKKYYVRVRSYKKSGKETLYGAWSKVNSTSKIKK